MADPAAGPFADLAAWETAISGDVPDNNIMYYYQTNVWANLGPVPDAPPAGAAATPPNELPRSDEIRSAYDQAVFETLTEGAPGAVPRNLKAFAGANIDSKKKEAANLAATAHWNGMQAAMLKMIRIATVRARNADPAFVQVIQRNPTPAQLADERKNALFRVYTRLLNGAGLKKLDIDFEAFPNCFRTRPNEEYDDLTVRGLNRNRLGDLSNVAKKEYYIAFATEKMLGKENTDAEAAGEGAVVAYLNTQADAKGPTGQVYPEVLDTIRRLTIGRMTAGPESGQVSIGAMQFFGNDPVLKQKHWSGIWNSRKIFHKLDDRLRTAFTEEGYPNSAEGKDAFLHNVLNSLERGYVTTGPFNLPRKPNANGSISIKLKGGRKGRRKTHRKSQRKNRKTHRRN